MRLGLVNTTLRRTLCHWASVEVTGEVENRVMVQVEGYVYPAVFSGHAVVLEAAARVILGCKAAGFGRESVSPTPHPLTMDRVALYKGFPSKSNRESLGRRVRDPTPPATSKKVAKEGGSSPRVMFTAWLKGMLVGVTVALGDTVSVEAREAVEEGEVEMEMEAELEKEGEGELEVVEVGVCVSLSVGVAVELAVIRGDKLDVLEVDTVRDDTTVEVEDLETKLVREGDAVGVDWTDGVPQLAVPLTDTLMVTFRVPAPRGLDVNVVDTLCVNEPVTLGVMEVDWDGDRVSEGLGVSDWEPEGEDDGELEKVSSWAQVHCGVQTARRKNTWSIARSIAQEAKDCRGRRARWWRAKG